MDHDLFIFDLDDTLILTEKIHHECWASVLQNDMDYDQFCKIFHTEIEGGIEHYLRDTLGIQNYQDVMQRKTQLYIDTLLNTPERFKLNGCEDLLNSIVNSGNQFIIVTNTRKAVVAHILERFPILTLSSRVYCREDLSRPKPNPSCYIQVLKDFPCKNPIIFEDSLTGIIAARNSPCKDVVFVNTSSYVHYDTVIEKYSPISIIPNFVGLNNHTVGI
jgi:HAD superfamily hydrolase (TIGR01509 family)